MGMDSEGVEEAPSEGGTTQSEHMDMTVQKGISPDNTLTLFAQNIEGHGVYMEALITMNLQSYARQMHR